MNVYRSLDSIPFDPDSIITLGTFDGIHLGHRRIIDKIVHRSRKASLRSVLITFTPHPQTVVRSRKGTVEYLTTLDEKLEILQETDLDAVCIITFTLKFSKTAPAEFIRGLIEHIGFRECVIGYNHKFGERRQGDIGRLHELGRLHGFSVDIIEPIRVNGVEVSSTLIRKALHGGEVTRAARYLGRPYRIRAKVIRGNQLGDQMGFPTANLDVSGEHKLIPDDGVYAVFVNCAEDRYFGMANIGNRPTIDGAAHVIEVHIHDFEENLYGRFISIDFIQRLRGERRFKNIEALISQIKSDKIETEKILSKHV